MKTRKTLSSMAPSTVGKLRTQVRGSVRPFCAYIKRGPRGQQTRTEHRWRCAERRGLARVEPMLDGYLVTLTPQGEGYLGD